MEPTADIALIECRRLVRRGDFLGGRVVVFFVQQNDTIVSHDEIERPDLTALLGPRFQIDKLDFEDGTPRHLRDPRCDHSRGQRDFGLNIFVIPFRAAKICRDRFVILGVKKRIGRKRRRHKQDRHHHDLDVNEIFHVRILAADLLTLHPRIS